MLFCIGDSHTKSFRRIAKFLPRVRSTTLYTSCKDDTFNFQEQGVVEDSVVIVSFGEIDVRCRIHQQVEKGRDAKEVVSDIVQAFVAKITEEKKKYKKKIYPVCKNNCNTFTFGRACFWF